MATTLVEAEVRLRLTNVRKDLESLKSAWRLAGKKMVTDLQTSSSDLYGTVKQMMTNIDLMATRSAKGMSRVIKFDKEFKDMRTLFINLAKSDPTNKNYLKTIGILDDLIARSKAYHDTSNKIAKTKKENIKLDEEGAVKSKKSWTDRIKNAAKTYVSYRLIHQVLQGVLQTLRNLVGVTIDYEQSMANTQSVMQATTSSLRAMDTAARNAGETTRFTATEAADALYFMASAGLSASDSVETLAGTLVMAQATGKSLRDTAEMMTVTLAQFNLKASESSRVANALTAGITSSQATMDKYKTSMYQIGPVASGMGRSLEEVIGVLDIMYDSGMQASRSGRAMRNALAELANESSNTVRKLKGMGIAFEDIDVSNNTLVDAFGTLNEAGLTTGQIMEAFGKVIGPQMQVLIRTSREELERYTSEVQNTNKAFMAAHIQNDTLQGDMFRTKSAFEALGITLGNTVVPLFRRIQQLIFETTRSMNKWMKSALGIRTSANEMADALTGVNEHMDEYSRLTTLLNDKTVKLTESERILYEQRRRASLTETLKDLALLSRSYDKTLKQEKELSVVAGYAEAVNKSAVAYQKLLDVASEVRKQGGNATKEQMQSMFILHDEINKLEVEVQGFKADTLFSGFGGTLAQEARTQLKKTKEGVKTLGEMSEEVGKILDKEYTGSFKDFMNTIMDISLNANEADVSLQALIETRQLTIAEAGRALAEEILTENQLVGMNAELAQSIRDSAKAYKEEKNAVTAKVAADYAEYLTLKDQLELTSSVTDQIKSTSTAQYESAVSTALASKNIDLINIGYARSKKAIEEQVAVLQKSIDAQAEANSLMVDENFNINGESRAILQSVIAQHKKNEENKLALAQTQALRKVIEEQVKAGKDYDTDELARLKALEARYVTATEKASEWSETLKKANYDARESAVETAYAEANSTADFENAYKQKLGILAEYEQTAKDELDKSAEQKVTAQKIESAKETDSLDALYATNIETLRQFNANRIAVIEQDDVERANIEATTYSDNLAELVSAYDEEQKALGTNVVAKRELTLQYNSDVETENTRHYKAIGDSGFTMQAEYAAQTKINDASLISLEKDHSAKVEEEKARLTQWILDNETFTAEEKLRIIAYYNIQEEKAEEDKKKAKQKKFEEALSASVSALTSSINAVNSAITAFYDQQLSAMELVQQRLMKDIQHRLEAELEANGVSTDDAVESAQKALDVAKASADELAVIDAEKALKKAEIDKKYADEKLQAEKDYAWAVAQISYASANTAWGLNMASSISSGILAIINAAKPGWPLNIVPVGLTTIAMGAQVAAQSAAKPVAPIQADYYASGGIIAGTPEGTHIIAGEKNKIEGIFNEGQMANLLMAIGNGRMSGARGNTTIEIVVQDMSKNELARYTVDALNGSKFLLDPNRALKKVATR